MRRAAVVFTAALVTLSLSAAMAAPQEKWARGKVTAIASDTITLDVKGQPMTFAVDTSATKFIARGGTTRTREAERTGIKTKLGDVVRVGDNVEVSYTESGGTMLAKTIRVGISAPSGTSDEKPKTLTLQGVISEVSGTSLTVKPASGDPITFQVDRKTQIVGRGLGTMAKEKQAAGEKISLTDTVAAGDTVAVTYTTVGEIKHATGVKVVAKK